MLFLPPCVDCHVHFREPGVEHKGNMKSESLAARAGGVSVVCEMPNTNPPTNTIAALQDKISRSKHATCDIRFFFGITAHEHIEQLTLLFTDPSFAEARARCCGLKLYLDHSTGNMKVDDDLLEEVFAVCARLKVVIVAHCEHAKVNHDGAEKTPYGEHATHSVRRPPLSEATSIAEAIALAEKYGTRLHIAHLSTVEGLRLVRAARLRGVAVTTEVTIHHRLFTSTLLCALKN